MTMGCHHRGQKDGHQAWGQQSMAATAAPASCGLLGGGGRAVMVAMVTEMAMDCLVWCRSRAAGCDVRNRCGRRSRRRAEWTCRQQVWMQIGLAVGNGMLLVAAGNRKRKCASPDTANTNTRDRGQIS
jgi:hypothetical protein